MNPSLKFLWVKKTEAKKNTLVEVAAKNTCAWVRGFEQCVYSVYVSMSDRTVVFSETQRGDRICSVSPQKER